VILERLRRTLPAISNTKHACQRRWGQFATNQNTKRKAKRKDESESRSPQSLIS